jgi:hypothetical protein
MLTVTLLIEKSFAPDELKGVWMLKEPDQALLPSPPISHHFWLSMTAHLVYSQQPSMLEAFSICSLRAFVT